MLDDGWDVPRCVDSCPTEALRFGDESDFADKLAASERLDPTSCVHYLNLPKRWVAGEVYDPEADEVVIGAKVTLANAEGTEAVAVTETDDFGDFWFRQIEALRPTRCGWRRKATCPATSPSMRARRT